MKNASKKSAAEIPAGDGINFYDGGRKTAHLMSSGRLCTFDEGGSPSFWESWRDYVKQEMGDTPVAGDDLDAITKQLSMALGAAEAAVVAVPTTTPKEEKNMPETNGAEKPKKTPKPKAEKVAKPKKEGKKYEVPTVGVMFNLAKDAKSIFVTGGDAKFKGLLKRVIEGTVAPANVPKVAFEKFSDIGFLNSGAFPQYTKVMKDLAKERGISLAQK